MVTALDINCDMGECSGNDEQLMPFITSANIACGYHAGSTGEMRKIIRMALTSGVAIGAHPSFADREHFGRREFQLPPMEIHRLVTEQILITQTIAREEGAVLHHIKPHGALYNLSAREETVASAIAAAIKDVAPSLVLYGLAGSLSIKAGLEAGLRVAREAFADRKYRSDGSLVPRSEPGAVIGVPAECVLQVSQLATAGSVMTVDGNRLPLSADTICIHSDSPGACETARAVAEGLTRLGIGRRAANPPNLY